MQWSEVLANPYLRDLPFKIETNEWGQIVMSPAKNVHGYLQSEVADVLKRALGGKTITECSVQTSRGVKVADVAWLSPAFVKERGLAEDPFAIAPEICVEIKSASNSRAMLLEKADLYLARGAKEVWVVDQKGITTIIGPGGVCAKSQFKVKPPASFL